MRVFNPKTGKSFFQKTRWRFDEAGQARELIFSCYRRYQFLNRDRTRLWFLEELESARQKWSFEPWAYLLMPEHCNHALRTSGRATQSAPQGVPPDPAPSLQAGTEKHPDERHPAGGHMRILSVGHGLGRDGRRCCAGFSLAFFPVMGDNRRKGESFAPPGDDENTMSLNLAAYYWFYFSPDGRGVGGGV